jgi:hypothetical protein
MKQNGAIEHLDQLKEYLKNHVIPKSQGDDLLLGTPPRTTTDEPYRPFTDEEIQKVFAALKDLVNSAGLPAKDILVEHYLDTKGQDWQVFRFLSTWWYEVATLIQKHEDSQ